ncbi:Dabb family protein [Cerasicoccus arenae]|nr:Dabb family protein [Cerasicoccus arenae]
MGDMPSLSVMLRTCFIAMGLFAMLAGCQTMPSAESSPEPGAVFHFLAIWLKDPTDQAARERIATQTEAWRDYPGVISTVCGQGLPGERTIVQNYDLGVMIVFTNEAALRAYEQDPAHQHIIREILAPAAEKVMIYDFLVSNEAATGVSRAILRQRQYQHYREFAN